MLRRVFTVAPDGATVTTVHGPDGPLSRERTHRGVLHGSPAIEAFDRGVLIFRADYRHGKFISSKVGA